MPKVTLTEEVLEERKKRAQELKDFMVNNKFTERRLGEIVGVSRRSIQMIKAARITPHLDTLRRLETLYLKYKSNK